MFRLVLLTCIFTLACGGSVGPISRDQSRIFGSEIIDISQAPWHVAILWENTEDGYVHFSCGGTIIGTKTVMTDAYCIGYPSDTSHMTVNVGSNGYNTGTVYEIENIVLHPEYEFPENDIAIITTVNEIVTGNLVAPAALPAPGTEVPDGITGTFTGWGYYDTEYQLSNDLRRIEVFVEDCNGTASDRIFCVDGLGTSGPCQGDAGGAFIVNGVVLGVSSFGKSCQGIGPTFFARVPFFLDWIRSQMQL